MDQSQAENTAKIQSFFTTKFGAKLKMSSFVFFTQNLESNN